MLKDYLKLHFIVLLWGFTAILGLLISIPAVELVFYRTLLASLGLLGLLLYRREPLGLGMAPILKMIGCGFLVSLHWILFFASARVSNASVCLAGMATCSLWTSLIEPLSGGKQVKWYEVMLGIVIVAGLYVIFHFEFNHVLGLSMALGSALLAALFTVINSKFTRHYHHYTITFYEMLGAFLCSLIFLPVYKAWLAPQGALQMVPLSTDWLYIGILAFVCTVYAYSVSVELMKRLTAYTVNLTVNLEPVYGIALAALFFNEHKQMTSGFYIGAAVILVAVLAYPAIQKWDEKRRYAARTSN